VQQALLHCGRLVQINKIASRLLKLAQIALRLRLRVAEQVASRLIRWPTTSDFRPLPIKILQMASWREALMAR